MASMISLRTLLAAAAICARGAGAAAANPVLSGSFGADNFAFAYLSTSADTLGTLIGHAPSWSAAYSVTPTTLNPGTTYYLNIEVINGDTGTDSDGGLLGEFSLTGGATFANGSQTVLTGDSGWVASYNNNNNNDTAQPWLQPTGTVSIEGPNGSTGPWGTVTGISTSADWVWAADASTSSSPGAQCAACTVDLQIAISTAIPEPASAALTLVAVTALGLVHRRKPAKRGSACKAVAERLAG